MLVWLYTENMFGFIRISSQHIITTSWYVDFTFSNKYTVWVLIGSHFSKY